MIKLLTSFIFIISTSTFAKELIDTSGFLTFGASRTDNYETFYYRYEINNKINYTKDTLVGLNLTSHISEDFSAVVQLLYKNNLDTLEFYPSIEMAFLRYKLFRGFFRRPVE